MKTNIVKLLLCCIGVGYFVSCTKETTVLQPLYPYGPGTTNSTYVFKGDTTTIKFNNLTVKYFGTSPCDTTIGEKFYFWVDSTPFNITTTYIWKFGDGKSMTGTNVFNAYDFMGNYPLTVDVKDANSNTLMTLTATVKAYGQRQRPITSYYTQYNNPSDKNYIAFNSQSKVLEGSIVNYLWDWNDGSTDSVSQSYTEHYFPQIPQDKYYDVKLTAVSKAGCKGVSTQAVFVPAKYNLPCKFTMSASNHCKLDTETFTFIADTVGVPQGVRYRWTWGDGTVTETPNFWIQHRYAFNNVENEIYQIMRNGVEQCNQVKGFRSWGIDVTPKMSGNIYPKYTIADTVYYEFNSTSSVGNSCIINYTRWDFGDGNQNNTNSSFVGHKFIKQPTVKN